MKKYLIFCVLVVLPLSAGSCCPEEPKVCEEPPPPPPEPEIKCLPPRSCCTESAVDQQCILFILSADYIFWLAKEAGLATTASQFANTGLDPNEAQGIIYPKFKTRSGFKVGAGVGFEDNDWNIFIQYTWYYNKGNPLGTVYTFSTDNVDEYGQFTLPAWLIGEPPAFPLNRGFAVINSSTSSWNMFFNRIDGTFSRQFWAGKNSIVRPFLGILGFWDSQKLRVDYTSIDSDFGDYENHVFATQDGSGVGPYLGQSLEFCVYYDYNNQAGFWGKWGGSLLWSEFKANVRNTWDHTEQENQLKQKSRNVFYTAAPMLEVAFGFRWTMWFCAQAFFMLQAGWELSAWFDHNYMISNLITRSSGTCNALYTMQGLTIHVEFGF